MYGFFGYEPGMRMPNPLLNGNYEGLGPTFMSEPFVETPVLLNFGANQPMIMTEAHVCIVPKYVPVFIP